MEATGPIVFIVSKQQGMDVGPQLIFFIFFQSRNSLSEMSSQPCTEVCFLVDAKVKRTVRKTNQRINE